MKKNFFKAKNVKRKYSKARRSKHCDVRKQRNIQQKLKALSRNNKDVLDECELPFIQPIRKDYEIVCHFEGDYSMDKFTIKLQRFLASKLGWRWDDVYRELCHECKRSEDVWLLKNVNDSLFNERGFFKYCVKEGLVQNQN